MSEFDVTKFLHETPKVIKNLKKQYSLEKSIAIDELKVSLKKSSRQLHPSEMVDVLEEFIDGLTLDEETIKFESFRISTDNETFLGKEVHEDVIPPQVTVLQPEVEQSA
jgi:hypothetical protein